MVTAEPVGRDHRKRSIAIRPDHFRDGAYDPSSAHGLELLAHEIGHIVQQGETPTRQDKFEVVSETDGAEVEAD